MRNVLKIQIFTQYYKFYRKQKFPIDDFVKITRKIFSCKISFADKSDILLTKLIILGGIQYILLYKRGCCASQRKF